ncbi:sodium/hydrogen exchanger 9B1 isoform X3 [Tupaia chinensis]|uniref:sodium/hydrogen exchanger 9B1 isoform X3 n=1 Tax=Tupaia chinensis TaxID=246437 RepID=UPI0003C8C91C|nr:sodium/hydrogen exchanger 9B1 isoform X3 [Tupaia chinensis]
MHITESNYEHLEKKDPPVSTVSQPLYTVIEIPEKDSIPEDTVNQQREPELQQVNHEQLPSDPNSSAPEETKETVLSKKEEIKPGLEKKTCLSCPPRGQLNRVITSGMLLAGFIIRNVPFISEHVHIQSVWSSALRSTALAIILIRAGLGLDPQALRHLKAVCLRLSMGPCLMEACSAALFSRLIMKLSWQWGFLLGFVVGAVSPAVVVPSMLFLQENGYGVEKGIPTLLIAASSMDDVVAITGFTTCMSLVFSPGGVINNLLSSLRDVLIGLMVGTVLGIILRYFPSGDQTKLTFKRALLVLSMCLSAVLGSQRIGLHASGGLCTLVLTFIAGTTWADEKIGVQRLIAAAWNIFQPLLFGLVGAEVNVSSLQSNTIGICVATISLSLCVRILTTYTLMCFAGFSMKEKIFIALSWMPKATVQAVLGPLALETARISAPYLETYSKDVMTVAFLSILITAPNGALLIGILGPKMLTRCYDPGKVEAQLSECKHH